MPEENKPNEDETTEEGSGEENDELEAVRAELAESKKEQTKLRKQLSEARKKSKESKPSEEGNAGTPDEQTQQQLAEMRQRTDQLQSKLQRARAANIASNMRVVDPEAVVALIDWDDIEDPDDDAEIKDAIKALVKRKPYLAKKADLDGGAGGGRRQQKRSMNEILRAPRGR